MNWYDCDDLEEILKFQCERVETLFNEQNWNDLSPYITVVYYPTIWEFDGVHRYKIAFRNIEDESWWILNYGK